jgi:endonuclease/exonuclease/phosphatase family metal-dependent hydrolase
MSQSRALPFRRRSSAGRRALRTVFLVSLLAAGCATSNPEPAPAAPPLDVRVMSFNIRYGTANDGADAWPLRRDLALRVVRDFAPTVLGVQEALHFQIEELRAAFPDYGVVGVGRSDGVEAGEYAAILFDARRLRVVESGTFWLSETPDVPGSMHWGNRITRIATWARFHDRARDTTFVVFNTHWDHESQPSRERSARLVLDRIAARNPAVPLILTGDFNAGEDNAAFRALLSDARAAAALVDSFRVVHPDATGTGTFHGFRGTPGADRIDAIFTSPHWRVLDAAIVRTQSAGRFPSDHFPVTAVLRLDD